MTLRHHLDKAARLMSHEPADDNLLDDLQRLIDSAEEFLESTASYSGAEIESARARVASQLSAARANARHHRRSRARQRATQLVRSSGQAVREHKWETAGLVAAGAALIGGIYAGMKLTRNGTARRR